MQPWRSKNQLSEKEIIRLAEQTIAKIKNSPSNPYKNMAFVTEVLGKTSLCEDVKNILKGKYNGTLNENVFKTSKLSKAKHLYNFLYENNKLSKYNEIADHMGFPKVTHLMEGDYFEENSMDEGQQRDQLAEDIFDTVKKK